MVLGVRHELYAVVQVAILWELPIAAPSLLWKTQNQGGHSVDNTHRYHAPRIRRMFHVISPLSTVDLQIRKSKDAVSTYFPEQMDSSSIRTVVFCDSDEFVPVPPSLVQPKSNN